MIDPSWVSVLASQLGGVDILADELGVSPTIIYKILRGERLTRKERLTFERAATEWEDFETEYEGNEPDRIDLDEVDDLARDLDKRYLTRWTIPDERFYPIIRESIADGRLSWEDILVDDEATVAPLDVFFEITVWQADKLLEYISDGGDLSEALQFYINDKAQGDWQNVEDSEFWEWFRSVFYE